MNIKPLTSQWNKPRLATQSCASCNAFLPNKQANPKAGEPRLGACRASPPIPMPAITVNALGQQVPSVQGIWPPTNSDMWCRGYEEKSDEPTPAA